MQTITTIKEEIKEEINLIKLFFIELDERTKKEKELIKKIQNNAKKEEKELKKLFNYLIKD